jgi:hypothetical protein
MRNALPCRADAQKQAVHNMLAALTVTDWHVRMKGWGVKPELINLHHAIAMRTC